MLGIALVVLLVATLSGCASTTSFESQQFPVYKPIPPTIPPTTNEDFSVKINATVKETDLNTPVKKETQSNELKNVENTVVKSETQSPKITEEEIILPKEKKEPEKIRTFVQVNKGCAFNIDKKTCLYARSGVGTTTKALFPLRVNMLLEIDPEYTTKDSGGIAWHKVIQGFGDTYPAYVGNPWFVPANQIEIVFMPPEPPADATKKIVIDLSEQRLRAYKNNKLIREVVVSTGRGGWATPTGKFHISKKLPSRYMKSSPGASDWYDLPGVSYTMYFTIRGAAIHCEYWHDQLGTRRSHGCVNTDCVDARWLYGWTPLGTPVFVQN